MAVSQRITLEIKTTETGSGDLGTPRKVHTFNHGGASGANFEVFATGTTDASFQQDLVHSDTISLAGSATALDLAGGLTDAFGTAITMVEVTGITVRNNSTTTGEIIIIGAGSNPLLNWVNATGDAVKIGPKGVFHISSPFNGFAVTAGTGDILTLDPGADTISCDYIIHGRSA